MTLEMGYVESPQAYVYGSRPATEAVVQGRAELKVVANAMLLAMMKNINASLQELAESALRLSHQEAATVLIALEAETNYRPALKLSTQVVQAQGAQRTPIDEQFFLLCIRILEMNENLRIAADTTKVNEDSEDYAHFMLKMVTDAEKDGDRVHGRKAVQKLFD
jgi:phage gp46-like protein